MFNIISEFIDDSVLNKNELVDKLSTKVQEIFEKVSGGISSAVLHHV